MCTTQNNNQVSKEDKQLAILILLILAIITTCPCLSHQLAMQLDVQIYSLVRIISVIMFVIAIVIMKFTGGKGDKSNARRGEEVTNAKHHIS